MSSKRQRARIDELYGITVQSWIHGRAVFHQAEVWNRDTGVTVYTGPIKDSKADAEDDAYTVVAATLSRFK